MHRILVATRNRHKTREFGQLLGDAFAVRDLNSTAGMPAVAETGSTFEENAVLKAIAASRYFSEDIVADDSGLEVDILDGEPGIYSARYAGEQATGAENITKLLAELRRRAPLVASPTARFRCALAFARAGKIRGVFHGVVEGRIVSAPRGSEGFGYDPIFLPDGFEKTFGELSDAEKNRISHRARAIGSLRASLLEKIRGETR